MSASMVLALAQQADVYARALDARDARFDGVFFVGIITTRIYCRPVCNFDAWYDAFDVRPDQKLYLAPAARVRIW